MKLALSVAVVLLTGSETQGMSTVDETETHDIVGNHKQLNGKFHGIEMWYTLAITRSC
jgi:hypothetical protein